MKASYEASIYYDMKENHPDLHLVKDSKNKSFTDTYEIETDTLWGEPIEYIKGDLKLIAGGGYSCDTIENVRFFFNKK